MNKQYVGNSYYFERVGGSLNFKVKEFETTAQQACPGLGQDNGELEICLP